MTAERSRVACGSWPTPVTAARVVESSRTPSGVAFDGGDVYWSELRPEEGGRTAIVRCGADGSTADVLPVDANARTKVHEYGGGAWWVRDGVVWYVDWADQRLRRIDPGPDSEPVVLTPAPPAGGSFRWADGDVDPRDGRLAVVRETHPVGGRGAVDVVNEVVVIDSSGGLDTVASGADFVSDPRWSPDGSALAWLEWNHPAMPWDASTLKVQTEMGVVTVAGGVDQPSEGICQPRWAPDGSLWFCSDRDDWWLLHRWTQSGGVEQMVELPGEVGRPKWVFGPMRYDFLPGGRVVFAILHDGKDSVWLRDPDGALAEVDLGVTCVDDLAAHDDSVVLIGSSADTEPAVRRFRVGSEGAVVGEVETLSATRETGVDAAWISLPEHIEFPGGDGRPTYANFYPPTNPTAQPLEGELPPLIVTIHGGPTSNAVTTLAPARQFWTSRGFAVADVDYGGSTGYGRAYRNRLQGQWGVLDVGDCVAVVRWLGDQGWIDPARAVIRGGSAGGFTVLMALALHDVYAAGADYFGVADVEALARETHKFESRYLDGLIAPYPEGRDRYVERSPLTHLDTLSAPLVVFQGAEDRVVPPEQSEMIVAALREKGLPVAYRSYDGEQHGFRQAANIIDSLEAELSFYAQVLGFELPPEESVPRLEIENLHPATTSPVQIGRERQSAIYRAGVLGRRPAVPTDFAELERRAKRACSTKGWAYVAGGAGEGRTMRNNRTAFDRWVIVPRMAHGVTSRDLGVDLLGTRLDAPVLLAPVGAGQLIDPDCDLHVARAAAAVGVPYVFTNQGGTPMEECAAAMGAGQRWVQLYWSTDEALVDSLIQRAEAIGAGALVVTLDTTTLGWRPQDLNLGSLPFAQGLGIGQYTSDPRFRELVRERIAAARASGVKQEVEVTLGAIRSLLSITRNHPGRFLANLRSPEPRASVEAFLDIYSNPGLSWDHLATLRERTRLPVVLKGILHPDDARRAFDQGVDAIVVSNHGGRQVDSSIASLDALQDIRDAVGDGPTVLMDSGIRTGADVFTALALGADAVLLGRPYMYGLAVAGQRGVEEVVSNVIAELDLTMSLTGARTLADITTDLLRVHPCG